MLIAGIARADMVHVEVKGPVDDNVIGGAMAGTLSGMPVTMGFHVDSTIFTNSGSFPVRGDEIDLNSFSMTVGAVPVPVVIPQSVPSAYFVLRDNDPAVDGFYVS
ncbi:MAG: hypothetical protein ACREJC_22145 [Tepidisphaeraceae bacterium]